MNIPYHNKALPKGTILREWELEDVLGVGGFGIVYRAKGVYFGEEVAIKEYFPGAISDRQDGTTVTPTDSSSEEVYALGLKKFLEEAKVLWGLSKPERHPNIVNVRSLFEIHGTAYMVMDFERGTSLSQMLKDGRTFDEASLMALLRPIAEGLDRAHRAGVLHRDIKPANILVDDTGRPVLIDFGSARFESGQATNTKVTFYTPPYAAIEQYVKTYPQGAWTDIYALGVVLYQCVTGEKPLEVLERMHGEHDQPLSAREWPGYSPTFIRAVDAAMGIRPLERPASIPAWLKMFEAKDAPQPDDATRIAIRTQDIPAPTVAAAPLPVPPPETAPAPVAVPVIPATEPVSISAPMPVPAPILTPAPTPVLAASIPPVTAVPMPKPPARRHWVLWTTTACVVLVAAGLAARFLLPLHGASPKPVSPIAPMVAAAKPVVHPPEEEASGLLTDAQRLGRPQKEIAALTDSNSKIAALAAQIHGLGSTSDAAAKAAPLKTQINDLAANMSHNEATALERAGKLLWRDMAPSPGKAVPADAAAATAAAGQAKTKLDDAVAAVLQTPDAALSLQAARQALAAYDTFASAYGAAAQFYISARRNDFTALETAARATSDKLAALGKVSQPWLLASHARKQAYQELVDDATAATAQIAQLTALEHGVTTAKDLRQVSAALTQATTINATLDGLLAKSNAAYPIYNQ